MKARFDAWLRRLRQVGPFGSATYPIYRRELVHWDQRLGGHWRLGELFGVLTLGSLCLLPATIIIYPAALLAYAALDELIALGVLLPASALVVREREARTWSVLRATPYSSGQIAIGKLSGLLYQVWEGAGYLVNARWLGTVLVVPLLALMLTLPHPFPFAAGQWTVAAIAGLALAYGLFIYRPVLNLLYGGALGLAASTVTRSSAGALVLAVVVGGALSIAAGTLVWFYWSAFDPAQLFSESVLAGRLARIFVWLVPLGLISLVRLALTAAFLAVASNRISRLTD